MANLFYEQLEEQSSGKYKIELEILKDRLKRINEDIYWFWEEHLSETRPDRILIFWGQLRYMMWIKSNTEMSIERIEMELNKNDKIH